MHAVSEFLTGDPITHASADPGLKVSAQCTVHVAADVSDGG